MGIESIVNVQISRQTQGVSQAGFGVPLIMGVNAAFSGIREYGSLSAVGADFSTSQDEYKMAAKIFSQSPHPQVVKIRKAAAYVAQVARVVVASVVNSSLYSIVINGVTYSFTSDGSATVAEIRDGLIAAVNAGSEPVTASASSNDVLLTSDSSGLPFSVSVGDAKLTLSEDVANVGIDTAILAAVQEDNDWYCLLTALIDDVTVLVGAATIEALRKIYIVRRSDSNIRTNATNDIATKLKDHDYFRTAVEYTGTLTDYPDAALAGRVLPTNPGSETWMFKTLAGVTVDKWTDSEKAYLDGKNVDYYVPFGGVNITINGKVSGGEYIDIIRGIDWLQARIEEGILQLLISVDKVPFTDAGIASIEAVLRAKLLSGVRQGLIASEKDFTITVPLAKDVSQQDKAARTLTGVSFTAVLAGAIHAVNIQGVVTL